MTSLSDSQNIDVDPNSGGVNPQLPSGSPLQSCPHCEALIDITEREPLEVIDCPGCGQPFAVTGQIDHYQIIDIAGKGGMGVVYKAYDPGLDRYIALKLLKKHQSNDLKLIQQLETEAAITASITDSNVVRVYGTGRDRGRFFLAMELVDKGSLDDLIRLQGRVAEAQVLQVGIQIASGLRAAQQHGLIHRDVKPGNILFADAQTAKIVDFGLAIFMEQEESVRGEIWGTPYYVAPEKLDQEPEDFRSDMYSLGATLFHALAGRPPFEAENASMVALKHLKSQAVSLQAFAPWVSNPTAHIINRTLLKNPDGRYQTYDELIHNFGYALEQLQEHGNAPQQRARVVLETDEDRKGWTWVVLGMAVVMIGLLVAFFTMRPKGNTTAANGSRTTGAVPAADAASSQGKFESLDGPLSAMAGREKDAVEKFREALTSESLSPTDRAWAQYLEGVAALGTDRTMDARTAFSRVEPLAARVKDAALGKFLADSSARLVGGQRVALGDTAVLARSNYEAIGLLAYGLQNWQIGEIEDGASLLRQFRSAQPAEDYRWFNSLKPLANNFIEQLTEFEMALGRFKEAKSPSQRAAEANIIRGFSPALARRADAVIKPFAKEIEDQRLLLTKLPDEGLYRVTNRKSGKSLDVSGYNTGQGGSLTQYDFRGQPNQILEFSKSGAGAFRFRPIHASTSIDVPNSKLDDGLEIKTWTSNATSAQQWEVEPQGDGWYKLKSVCSNKLLSLQNQSADNGAKVVQMSDKAGLDQQWKAEPLGRKLTGDWFASTIGPRHESDKAEHKDGVFKLTDQGADIWGRSDKANFVMRPVQGDFDLSVRVINPGKGHEWIKAGLMARPGINGDQMNVAAMISANRIVTHQRRIASGEDSLSVKIPDQSLPHWLKMERRGNKFTTFHSADGQSWQEIGNDTVKMHNHVLIGLVLTSHDPNKAATAEFDNLTYTKK